MTLGKLDPEKVDTWKSDLFHDIEVIRRANIYPHALMRRLSDVAAGRRGDKKSDTRRNKEKATYYPEFRRPVRGTSNYSISGGFHTITLVFGCRLQAAQEVYEQLQSVATEFRAITELKLRTVPHVTISLYIPVRDLE